jgi:hypothetical protein
MPRSPMLLAIAVFAAALLAVPAALASGPDHREVRIQGKCTQQSTSKLKLSREDRGIEVEFEVDQNRNRVPWHVTLRRNGRAIATLRAVTHAPSGSFEIRRVVAGRLGSDRIAAVAIRNGETCNAAAAAPRANAVADDHGSDG